MKPLSARADKKRGSHSCPHRRHTHEKQKKCFGSTDEPLGLIKYPATSDRQPAIADGKT